MTMLPQLPLHPFYNHCCFTKCDLFTALVPQQKYIPVLLMSYPIMCCAHRQKKTLMTWAKKNNRIRSNVFALGARSRRPLEMREEKIDFSSNGYAFNAALVLYIGQGAVPHPFYTTRTRPHPAFSMILVSLSRAHEEFCVSAKQVGRNRNGDLFYLDSQIHLYYFLQFKRPY